MNCNCCIEVEIMFLLLKNAKVKAQNHDHIIILTYCLCPKAQNACQEPVQVPVLAKPAGANVRDIRFLYIGPSGLKLTNMLQNFAC